MHITCDPVMDAENYQLEHCDEGRAYIECDYCHGPIYKEDGYHYGDRYYHVNGLDICDNCINKYLNEIVKECA